MSEQREALGRALHAMERVTVFVTSRQRIHKPAGEQWWAEAIEAVRVAMDLPDPSEQCPECGALVASLRECEFGIEPRFVAVSVAPQCAFARRAQPEEAGK